MQNGILVPKRELEPIHIFVDETFLQGRSGFLQAGFPVPKNIYDTIIVPKARELLAQLGPDAREFKGVAIKPGNAGPYRDFLHLFTNISAHIADHAPLYPVVSLDGMSPYTGQQFDCVQFNVVGALKNLGITDADQLAGEFSRQMLWLHHHLPLIAPQGFRNDVIFTFDAKYLHAERAQAHRFFSGGQLIAATVSTLEKTLTSCANTLFSYAKSEMRLENIGRVAGFRFIRSPEQFGLQAADVLCHLIYSGLRHAMGIADSKTEYKARLLEEVMPALAIDDDLRSRLSVVAGNDNRDDIHLDDPDLRSRFQISPD